MPAESNGRGVADFRDLIIETLPHLRAYARSLTGRADQADDLVQDTVLRLLDAQHQFQPGTNFRAWAIAILRNRFIDQRRRDRYQGGSIDDLPEALFCGQPSQEAIVYFEEATREFWRLSPAHREIITIVAINGLSYEEAAKILGCPIGTVRSRLARARCELGTALDQGPRTRIGNAAPRAAQVG